MRQVEYLQGNRVVTFDGIMGSGRTESMEGRTRYTTTAIGDDGNLVEGTYNRDGTRIGVTEQLDAGPDAIATPHARNVLEGLGVPCGSGSCNEEGTLIPTEEFIVLRLENKIPYETWHGMLRHPPHLRGTSTVNHAERIV